MGRGRSSSGGSRGSSFSSSRGSSSSSRRSSSSSRGWSSGTRWGGVRTYSTIGSTTYYSGGGSSSGSSSGSSKVALTIAGVIFIVMALITLGAGFSIINDSNDYATTQGTAISNTYTGGWYYTTYDYTVDGQDYTSTSDEGWELPETVGKTVTIYYLKDNPYVITEKETQSTGASGILIIVGVVFGVIGIVLVVSAAKMKKETKVASETTTTEINTPSEKTSNDIICPYCGSKYNASLNSCPKCGAGKH